MQDIYKHPIKTRIYWIATEIYDWDIPLVSWVADKVRDWTFNEDLYID